MKTLDEKIEAARQAVYTAQTKLNRLLCEKHYKPVFNVSDLRQNMITYCQTKRSTNPSE